MTEKRLLRQVSQLSGAYPSRKEAMQSPPQEALFPINPLMG